MKDLITLFIRAADQDALTQPEGHGLQVPGGGPRSVLLEHHPPEKLRSLLDFSLPQSGTGRDGLLTAAKSILQYSVNTWDQGFLDKLYSATTPVGLAADLLLSALNTNVHVYSVAPALTLIEQATAKALARDLFGLTGAQAGGVTQSGGSAANMSALVIARHHHFPAIKTDGLVAGTGGKQPVIFVSAHGHYSLTQAAQFTGLGSAAIRRIPVDPLGRMLPAELEAAITASRAATQPPEAPFFVCATAGTTVFGAFDPLPALADICRREQLWFHIDGSWGGAVAFSPPRRATLLQGSNHADSIALCAHKMLGVPLPCSFLLGADLRRFHAAMKVGDAGYLFHQTSDDEVAAGGELQEGENVREFNDLAELTPQCGRRGDALKLALTWLYAGADGLAEHVERGYAAAAYLTELVRAKPEMFEVVGAEEGQAPPCLQVCFYVRRPRRDDDDDDAAATPRAEKEEDDESEEWFNTRVTERVVRKLLPRGFMTDYAPGDGARGKFLRVVVNGQTRRGTLDGLVKALETVGREAVEEVEEELKGEKEKTK